MRFFIIIIFLSTSAIAQNLIINGGFESLTEPIGFYDCNSSLAGGGGQMTDARCHPFFLGKVPNWDCYSYSPEIVAASDYPGLTGGSGALGYYSAGVNPFYEGVFQKRDLLLVNGNFIREKIFKSGKTYVVSLKFMFTNGSLGAINPSIKLMAGTFFSDRNINITATPLNDLNNPFNDVIGVTSNTLAVNQWHYYTVFYSPTGDKEGIAIVPIGGSGTNSKIIFDDVSVIESCCIANRAYTNIVNPPSLNVQDYIICNSNVTFNSNSNTNLSAKNGVTLTNNTTIDGVNFFIAQAEDCLAKPVQMFPSIVQIGCDYKFKIDACYGSGLYEFYFNEVLDSDGELIIPVGNATITSMNFKVKDKVAQTIVTQSINVPVKRYSGNITVQALPNVITPNNDGINDYFRVKDNDKTAFAYNANKYSIQIWDRWGGLWHEEIDKTPGINGFSDTEVFWDGRKRKGTNIGACFSDGGTAYYLLTFKNCEGVNDKTYNGSITVIGCTKGLSKTGNLDDNSLVFENQQTKISPNPVNTILNIGVFSDNVNITIMDMLGKEQKLDCTLLEKYNGYSTFGLDCSQLTNGIYFCNINKGEAIETIKFSVIK